MAFADIPNVRSKQNGEDLEQYVQYLANNLALLSEQLEFVVNGNVNSKNILEVGGWKVSRTKLESGDGDVGMSTLDTAADDIRFWAGDAITGTPKFKVTKAGIATLISMILQSVSTGDRIVIDATGFHSFDSSGVERIRCANTTAKGGKAWYFYGPTGPAGDASLITFDTETVDGASRTGIYIVGPDAQYLLFDDAGDIRLQDTLGKGFRTSAAGYPEMNNGSGWVKIAKEGLSGTKTYYVSDTSGGAVTRKLTFTNGILTSET